LLNYLSDIVDGAQSYADWVNGDLYERTEEKFGICTLPGMSESVLASFITDLNTVEALQTRLAMQPYNDYTAAEFQISSTDDWLRRRQGLALPVLPPTTLEARRYFFVKVREYAALATAQGKGKLDYEAFAREWNQSANGKDRFYITSEVLTTYAKVWDKVNNIRASQEMIKDKIDLVHQSRDIFAASHLPFPDFLTGTASQVQPHQGVVDIDPTQPGPSSISTELPVSHGRLLQLPEVSSLPETWTSEIPQSEPTVVTNV
jgi:hypothetical protein